MTTSQIKNFNALAQSLHIEILYQGVRHTVNSITTTHVTIGRVSDPVEISDITLPNLSNLEDGEIIVIDDFQGNNCKNKHGRIKKIVPSSDGFVYSIYFYNNDTRNSQWWIPEELIRPRTKKHILDI